MSRFYSHILRNPDNDAFMLYNSDDDYAIVNQDAMEEAAIAYYEGFKVYETSTMGLLVFPNGEGGSPFLIASWHRLNQGIVFCNNMLVCVSNEGSLMPSMTSACYVPQVCVRFCGMNRNDVFDTHIIPLPLEDTADNINRVKILLGSIANKFKYIEEAEDFFKNKQLSDWYSE